jgi:quercetin dioxygenase-like cupin family protein
MGPFAIALMIGAAASATIPTRTPIGSLPVAPSKTVTHVEMMKVEFLPGQAMPQHMHSVPIACVVSKGSFAVSIGRDPVRTASLGDTTIEPAGVVVHYFRNLSATAPAELYCAILAGPDDTKYSVMLNK